MKKILLIIIFILCVLIVATTYIVFNKYKSVITVNEDNSNVVSEDSNLVSMVYQIPNVPYIGIHNNQGQYRYIVGRNDTASALMTVLEYWKPGQHPVSSIDQFLLNSPATYFNLEEIKEYVDNLGGYEAEVLELELNELSNYINPTNHTPLITRLPVSLDQPKRLNYTPMVVLVGIDTDSKTLTFFDFWGGANKKITFDEYEEMQDYRLKERRNLFLLIQPEDKNALVQAPEENNTGYLLPETGPQVTELFNNFAIGMAAWDEGFTYEANLYLKSVVNSNNFEQIPPVYKTFFLNFYLEFLLSEERYSEAVEAGERAVVFNQGQAAEPFGYFGSFEYFFEDNEVGFRDRWNRVHTNLGNAYRGLEQYEKAREQYEKALEIYADDDRAQSALTGISGQQN